MASYTSREADHIPGSFPTDDMLSTSVGQSNLASSASHPHHNKLHKREDPRGWTDEGKTARGHQHTDSGVGLTDTSAPDYHAQSRANEKAFQSNQPSLQGYTEPDNASRITDAKRDNQHEIHRKPGVMTGAYSRLDDNNLNYPMSDTQSSNQQKISATKDVVGPSSTRTAALVTPEAEANLGNDNRGIAQDSLRQSSDFEHDDPYWGNVPYGTGTYNTITGHGSSETPAKGTVHSHGSQLNSDRERSFPLSTNDNAHRNELDNHNSSKFKEGVAAGTVGSAAAGAGLMASELPEKQKDHHREKEDLEESTSHRDDGKTTASGGIIASLFHWDHKEKETKPEKHEAKQEDQIKQQPPNHNNNPLTERDAGAALAAASATPGTKDNAHKHENSTTAAPYGHQNSAFDSRVNPTNDSPLATGNTNTHSQNTTQGINKTSPMTSDMNTGVHTSVSQAESTDHNGSMIGYGLGAAGLGTGAGYAIHEHANKDNKHQGQSTQPTYLTNTIPPPKTSTQPMHSSHIGDKALPVMVAGTAAPIASSEKKQVMPQASPQAKSPPSNPSHSHQYYTLADGTPSGMDIGDDSNAQKHQTTGTPSAARDVAPKNDHTGAKIAAASAGVAGAGAAAHHASKQNHDKNTTSGVRKAMDLDSSDVHSPHTEAAGSQAPVPASTSHHGGQHILRETMRPSKTGRDHHGDKDVSGSSPITGASGATKDNHDAGAKGTAATAAAAGVGVGAGGAAAHHHGKKQSNDKTAPSNSNMTRDQRSATTSSHAPHSSASAAAAGKSHARNRASTDSSHDGQYNVLASGTPSGINREYLVGRGSSDGNRDGDGLGGTEAAGGGNAVRSGTVGSGAAMKEKEKETGLGRTGGAAGVGAGAGTGMAASAAAALKAGDRVMHRCGKCGEENDITGYFHE